MSHFTLTVRLSAERLRQHDDDIESALEEILAPYNEQTEDRKFQEFQDNEDEYLDEYENKSTKKIKGPRGHLYWPWDDKFRVKGSFGTGSGTHDYKQLAGYTEVEVPFKKLYATFDEFCSQYHSSERDAEKGRHGYWRNPNAKWDWWVIGGRWSGHYPLKSTAPRRLGEPGAFNNAPTPDHGDIVRISDLDTDIIATQTRENAEKFYEEYVKLLAGEKFDAFDGPRSRAMSLGLLRVEQKPVEAGPGEVAMSWRDSVRADDKRADWTDVAKVIDRETFLRDYTDCFNPILTYAALDEEGWHAPGEMGWFGCSSDTPEAYLQFKNEFVRRFIKTAAADDVLVCVDCHI